MAADTRRILLVEDEKVFRDAVAAYLEREGYWVTPAEDGQVALDAFTKHRFELVVLDLMLPKVSGEEVCRQIRNASDVPIIMLTAKGEEEDRIAGLELGADDYLVKPFSPRELVARVRALLRRLPDDTGGQPAIPATLGFADLRIDLTTHDVFRGERRIDVTRTEFELLRFFLDHPRHVLSRAQLFQGVWGFDFGSSSNSLGVYVGYLRRKLEAAGEPRLLWTVRGVGYVLREDR